MPEVIDGRNEAAVRALKIRFGDFGEYGDVWIPNRAEILEFAEKNRDFTRQHVDLEYARSLGHPDLVAHGLLVLSKITFVRPDPTFKIVGIKSQDGVESQSKFRGWVYAGDEVHGRESIIDVRYSANRGKFFITSGFQLRVRSRDNKIAATGIYKVLYEFKF